MEQVFEHLNAASRVIEQRIATFESKIEDNEEDDNGFAHDLNDFLHTAALMDRHNIWFVCWRFLLSFTRRHYDVPGPKLTFGALWRTFGLCTNSCFPVFVASIEDDKPVSYENAFLILKRARDVSLCLWKCDRTAQFRNEKRIAEHLTKLRLELQTPHLNHVMFFAEWLFFLRSWFRVFVGPYVKDWSCNALDKELEQCTLVRGKDDNAKVSQAQTVEAVHVVKPIIHDVSLDAVFYAQAAAFFAQKPTALCFLYQPETSIIYSKIGRLNKVQIQNLDKVDQIRSLVQDLSKTSLSVGHRDIEPNQQFCLCITTHPHTKQVMSYTIVNGQEIHFDILQQLSAH